MREKPQPQVRPVSVSEPVSADYVTSVQWGHWLVIIFALTITAVAWYSSLIITKGNSARQFEYHANQVVTIFKERIERYEDALRSGAAAIQSNKGEIDSERWRIHIKNLEIEKRFPGIRGMGVVYLVPVEELTEFIKQQRAVEPDFDIPIVTRRALDFHLPVLFHESVRESNNSIGIDIARDESSRLAALHARHDGVSVITAPIISPDDSGSVSSYRLLKPFYDIESPWTALDRRNHFVGFIYADLNIEQLIESALQQNGLSDSLRILDGVTTIYSNSDGEWEQDDALSMFSSLQSVTVYGRQWRIELQANRSLSNKLNSKLPPVVLVGGLLLNVALLVLLLILLKTKNNNLAYSRNVTEKLRQHSINLTSINEDLENFAYVVSHDLKTPLRGIEGLASCIEEDLQNYLSSPEANSNIKRDLFRIREQTGRMNNLIGGILEYSSVGRKEELIETIDSRKSVVEIGNCLSLSEGQLVLQGEFPTLLTYRVRFEQTMANLIGNAFKYHDNPANARVLVSVSSFGNFYSFSVADNGPGIELKYHKKIFDVFQTLDRSNEMRSTGIGLSIVKKAVESLGGLVSVESEPGKGTIFRFLWPKDLDCDKTILFEE